MKYEKDKEHNMELRKTEKFKVMHANTGRLEKSSIIYMQHLLNQLTWDKKIILFGRDSRNPRFNEIAQSCMHFLINLVVPSLWIWVVRYIIWNKPYSLTRSLKYCCQIWIFLATRFPGCTTICRSVREWLFSCFFFWHSYQLLIQALLFWQR